MSQSARYENHVSLEDQDIDRTETLFKACVFKGEHNALRLHLANSPLQHNMILDKQLVYGMSCLRVNAPQLPGTVVALELLLQFGAKWDSRMYGSPYHKLSQCFGDHHQLLNSMIKLCGVKLLNVLDREGFTAVKHAVNSGNVECLKCLIAYNANLNIRWITTPLIDSILLQCATFPCAPGAMKRIFDLLLASGADINQPCNIGLSPIKYAVDYRSVYCAEKLTQRGAQFDLAKDNGKHLWFFAASYGSVGILKYLIEIGLDKTCTDMLGRNALHYAISRGDVTVCRYLLEAGATLPTSITKECNQVFYIKYPCDRPLDEFADPYLQAISLDLVQLLERYNCPTFQSIKALRCVVQQNHLKIVEYLLRTYKYPLNTEYILADGISDFYHTILTEACELNQVEMVALLMEYGADPVKKSEYRVCKSASIIAVNCKYVKLVAHFIRCGVSLEGRVFDVGHGYCLPFELSIIGRSIDIIKMLLYSGCSRGKFSLTNSIVFNDKLTPAIKKLMIDWEVQKNNVHPLKGLCRKSILSHLYPAVKKITKLPLPRMIITYLYIPELDDIIDSRDPFFERESEKLLRLLTAHGRRDDFTRPELSFSTQ